MIKSEELKREGEFVQQRRRENAQVSKIAANNGLLGENTSVKNALDFATKTRVINQELLHQVFKKAGLSVSESKD